MALQHLHHLLTPRVSAAASAATSPSEMPWKATSIAINRTQYIRALAPELVGTVTTLKPRLFTLDSLEKCKGLLCNLALTGWPIFIGP